MADDLPIPPPPPDQMIPILDPSGQLVTVPETDLVNALRQGFAPPSPGQLAQFRQMQAAEGFGQGAATFGEHALSALTFGVSPSLERAAGITTQAAQEARSEAHPVAGGVGTVVGIAAPLIATLGTSAPASGAAAAAQGAAKLTAPALIARAGGAAARAVAKAEFSGILGRVAPAAVGAALEGTAYAGQDVVARYLDNDPTLSGEKIAARLGLGALLGGTLGVGPKLLSEMIPVGAATKASEALAKFAGERNLKAAGAIEGDLTLATKQIGKERLTKIGQEMGDLGLVGPGMTPAKTLGAAEDLMAKAGADMGDILKAADAAAPQAGPSIENVLAKVRTEVLEPLKKNPMQQEAANKLAANLDGYAAKFEAAPVAEGRIGFADMHGVRKEISDALYGLRGNMDPFANSYKDALHDFRSIVSQELNDSLEKAGIEGANAAAWKTANRQYEVASRAAGFAQKGVNRAVGNNLISPMEALASMASGAGLTAAGAPHVGLGTLAAGAATALGRRQGSAVLGWASNKLSKTLIGLVDGADSAMAGKIGAIFSGEAEKGAAELGARMVDGKTYTKIASELNDHQNNMDRLAETVGQHTQELQTQAPGTADAIHGLVARGVGHLSSTLPRHDGHQEMDAAFEPSAAELATFNRGYEIAQNPMRLLDHVAAATLTPQHLSAAEMIYPRLLAEMRTQALDRLTTEVSKGHRIPYQSRLSLAAFLNQPLDSTMMPASVQANQLAWSSPSRQSTTPQPQAPGPATSTLADRTMTASQRLATRRG